MARRHSIARAVAGGLLATAGALAVMGAAGPVLAAQADQSDRFGGAEAAARSTIEWSGTLRSHWLDRRASANGPLAQAAGLVPGRYGAQPSSATVMGQLQGTAHWAGTQWHADITAQADRPEHALTGGPGTTQATVNEAFAAGALGQGSGWQYSLGKKVVSWDVGYGFRPNDMVQQEARRSLVTLPLEGRPLLMAEHFTADTALSLVAVNPTTDRQRTGAREPAVAARWFQRAGEADAYAFARNGQRTGTSVGAALSWVASESVELHASARHLQRYDTLAAQSVSGTAVAAGQLVSANPWQAASGGAANQVLLGGTWTSEEQVSVLLEGWYDGTALSRQAWQQWSSRNTALQQAAAHGAPATAVAGNLAWQTGALSASPSLRRQNLFARLSWTSGAWEPAVDLLWHPEDGGRMLTASLVWKGDQLRVEGGLRVNAGPRASVVRQLPVQRQAYVQAIWAF